MHKNILHRLPAIVKICMIAALLCGVYTPARALTADSSPPATGVEAAQPHDPPNQTGAPATVALQLEARLSEGGPVIKNGLIWRVFTPQVGLDNKLPLIAHLQGGPAEFNLPAGEYLVHAAFGRAGINKRITLEAGKPAFETLVLNAGGLKLDALLPEGKINKNQLRFFIYADASENNEQALILPDVKAGAVVRLNAGLYHVVSNYGTANAIVRSDIRVDAGKLTEATMQHRASQITLKLVRHKGGEALADTSWAIMNDSGDIVREIANANAYIILAEGDYVAVARNKDQIYQKEFSVSSGKDGEIDVLAIPQNSVDNASMD